MTTEEIEKILTEIKSDFSNYKEVAKKLNELIQQAKKDWEEDKCKNCVHSYQKKGTQGYHDVEEFYKE